MRYTGNVSLMGGSRGAYKVWWGDLKERDYLEDLGVDGMTTLKRIFKNRDGIALTGLMSLRIRTLGARSHKMRGIFG
jgi:hypothetical protein